MKKLVLFLAGMLVMVMLSCQVTVNISASAAVVLYTNQVSLQAVAVGAYSVTNGQEYSNFITTNWRQILETGVVSNRFDTNTGALAASFTNARVMTNLFTTAVFYNITWGFIEGIPATNSYTMGITNITVLTATNQFASIYGGLSAFTLTNGGLLSNFTVSNFSLPREWVVISNTATNSVLLKVTTNSGFIAQILADTNFTGTTTARCAPVTIYPSNGVLTNGGYVTLICDTAGASIMFSTNNGLDYLLYNNSFALSNTAYLKTYAVKAGYNSSLISASFFKVYKWRYLGSRGFSIGTADNNQIAFNSENNPCIVYSEYNNGYKINVKKYDGSNWLSLTSDITNVGLWPTIISDFDGILYISYREYWGNRTTVLRYNGIFWTNVGLTNFTPNISSRSDMSFGSDGLLYIAYRDELLGKPRVMLFNGTNWNSLGGALSSFGGDNISLFFGPDGAAYCSYREQSTAYGYISRFNVTDWSNLNIGALNYNSTSTIDTTISPENTIYLIYTDSSDGEKVKVVKYQHNNKSILGNTVSTIGASDLKIVIDLDNQPIVMYRDFSQASNITVKKYDGTSWFTIGKAGFNSTNVTQPFMIISKEGIPYVSFMDGAYSGKASVMKFDYKD